MMRRKEFVWSRYTGEDFTKSLSYSSEESNVSTPINISGFIFEVRFPEDTGISTITATITDAAAGEMEFSIPRAVSIGTAGNLYKAQLWRTSPNGDQELLIPGALVIKEGYLA